MMRPHSARYEKTTGSESDRHKSLVMTTVELSDAELQQVLAFTTALARKAGGLILEGSREIQASGRVDSKKNSVDLVTEWDVKVEELIRSEIETAYPVFKLSVITSTPENFLYHISNRSIGEESYSAGRQPPLTDDPTYCVDPIGAKHTWRPSGHFY